MAEQPEAMWLANALWPWQEGTTNTLSLAAAELRRLYSANEGQTRINVTLVLENSQLLREKLELLEALRPFTTATLTYNGAIIGLMREDFDRARAAIARAEGEQA